MKNAVIVGLVLCLAVFFAGTRASAGFKQPWDVTINGDSFVAFEWDSTGECTNITVVNSSIYARK